MAGTSDSASEHFEVVTAGARTRPTLMCSIDEGSHVNLFRPDSGDAVLARDTVAADQLRPVALGDELVECRLVLRGSQAVAGLPGRGTGNLAEDGCVAILHAVAVAADHDRLVALGSEGVEEGLVICGGHAMAGLPGRDALRLAPDGGVEILAAVEVAADPVECIALAGELVEGGLILRGSEAVAGDPGVGRTLVENAGETWAGGSGVAVHEHRVVALCGELGVGGLIGRSSPAGAGPAGGLGGRVGPEGCGERCPGAVAPNAHQLQAMVCAV